MYRGIGVKVLSLGFLSSIPPPSSVLSLSVVNRIPCIQLTFPPSSFFYFRLASEVRFFFLE